MGGLGPMMGQNGHFHMFAKEKVPYALARYAEEMDRLFNVADRRLGETQYLAGDNYSIADIASIGWMCPHERQGQSLDGLDNVKRWLDDVAARPAVQRGVAVFD
jgi:GSH-dependent disulfide-bond oxidoreductase